MKQSSQLQINRLTHAEFVQLVSQTLDSLEKKQSDYSDSLYDSLVARLKKKLPSLTSSLKDKTSSVNSKDIKDATSLRNGDITALCYAIKSHKKARTKEKLDAYQTLLEVINQYKHIKQGNAKTVSALVTSFLKRLALETNSQAIETLSLNDFVKNLQESQSALYNLYLNRAHIKAEKTDTTAELRESMTIDYRTLYIYLQAKLFANPEDDCKTVITILDGIRKDFQHTIKIRTKKTEVNQQNKETQPD